MICACSPAPSRRGTARARELAAARRQRQRAGCLAWLCGCAFHIAHGHHLRAAGLRAGQAFLSSALRGSDNTISQLKEQIAELTQSLSMGCPPGRNAHPGAGIAERAACRRPDASMPGLTSQVTADSTTISGLQESQKSSRRSSPMRRPRLLPPPGASPPCRPRRALGGGDLQSVSLILRR